MAVTSENVVLRREAKKGARFFESLLNKLEDNFKSVDLDEPLLMKWLFSVRANKGLTFANYTENIQPYTKG